MAMVEHGVQRQNGKPDQKTTDTVCATLPEVIAYMKSIQQLTTWTAIIGLQTSTQRMSPSSRQLHRGRQNYFYLQN